MHSKLGGCLSLVLLAACASTTSQVTPTPTPTSTSTPQSKSAPQSPPPSATPADPTLEVLEKAEFERPSDPVIKLKLARKLWCLNRSGQAFEHWLWLKRSASQTPQGIEALQRLQQARGEPDDLAEKLGCP